MDNIEMLGIGMEFKNYGEMCKYLNEKKKNAIPYTHQQEEWNRYFEYERDGRKCIITKIYNPPLPSLENALYKTITIPVKCNKTDYKYLMQCNKWSAEVWNYCVEQDKLNYKNNKQFLTRKELQSMVIGYTPLHAVGNQHMYIKYFTAREAMFKSMKANHENSDKVKLPYRHKKYLPTGWNQNCLTVDYKNGNINLARKLIKESKKKPIPVKCYCKTIPKHIVEIELLYQNGLKLAIKYKEPKTNTNIISNNSASIDLGEIHAITSIDNNGNAIIITGRKIRSIKQYRNKEQAKLRSKMSKCQKHSKQYKKYNRALYNIKYKTEKQILDCIHKISKLYLDYCLENNISKVYYGDIDSCTRNTHERVGKKVGQKLNEWNYGLLMLQLENKLGRYGIELVKVSEAYSSQTCPNCSERHHPTNRNYICECGYTQHRDIVGAINILNFNAGTKITKYINKKYLQIA